MIIERLGKARLETRPCQAEPAELLVVQHLGVPNFRTVAAHHALLDDAVQPLPSGASLAEILGVRDSAAQLCEIEPLAAQPSPMDIEGSLSILQSLN